MSRLKDEFLATLSHELRTPLHAIQGWSEVLQRPGSTQAEMARGLEAITRNVRIQTQIVNDLLDMSRIISGQVHLDVRPLELHEIIESAIAAIKPSVDGKRIRVETSLDTRVGIVRGDQSRMQQILWNLLSNAVKFTPSGGRISVGLRRAGSQAELIIADTGIGISSEFLPYVFDRFRQGDPGTARKFGGLGLGLSIVRSLVELHGGTVRVESPGENQGSTFTVSLPIYRVPTEALAQALEAPNRSTTRAVTELPRLDGLRLLLVDDDLDGCTLVARILEGRGAVVRATADPREGLEILRSERVDILLSDLGMPGMDGYEFITLVRKLERPGLGPIPAIAITAYARQEDRQRALLSGFQVHIAKPIEARELVAAIASLRPFLPR
ncbi:MAG: hybrid sensor histidine kinase/response regulator [Acetobacteraceae bacterium]|nr:hybrid sensor histidine kinase/response regulator [Acetobacteraceae bacterium]